MQAPATRMQIAVARAARTHRQATATSVVPRDTLAVPMANVTLKVCTPLTPCCMLPGGQSLLPRILSIFCKLFAGQGKFLLCNSCPDSFVV